MSSGADDAADAQKYATKMSVESQMKMFAEMKQVLAPFVGFGMESLGAFKQAMPGLMEGFDPSMAQLENTPGYQFALDQGQKGVANSFAAKGLANSGAALKGAAGYAQGLASNTFQQAFGNDMAQKSQQYNMLMAPMQMGANAAAMQGGNAMQLGANLGNTYQNQGNQLASIHMGDAAQRNQLIGTMLGQIPAMMGFL